MAFGSFVRQARLDRGLTQHQVGQSVGRGQRAAAAWEAGSKFPKDQIPQLADVLKVPVETLLRQWEDTFEPGMHSRMVSLATGSGKTEAIARLMLEFGPLLEHMTATMEQLATVTQRAVEVLDRLEQAAPPPPPDETRPVAAGRGKSRAAR